jgi:hypothetical protein
VRLAVRLAVRLVRLAGLAVRLVRFAGLAVRLVRFAVRIRVCCYEEEEMNHVLFVLKTWTKPYARNSRIAEFRTYLPKQRTTWMQIVRFHPKNVRSS